MRPDDEAYPWSPIAVREPCCEPKRHLDVRGLGVAYRGKTVVRDVTLPVYRGCITSLIGPSGCGKTSFLSSLNRLTDLVAGCEVNGHIKIEDDDIFAKSCDTRVLRRRIGMIFQKPNPFPLSIRRNLELPLREHGLTDKRKLAQTLETVLTSVGLWSEVKDRLDSPAQGLSGGQQQRLCIARALSLNPEVLLMDEPCSALDPIASATIENLIADLRGRYTIVIVTHNLAQARRISDYTAFFWMRNGCGELIEYGRAREIFTSPSDPLTRAYVRGVQG